MRSLARRLRVQFFRIGAALCLVTLAASSALAQVRTEHAEGTDFSNYKTFMWIKEPNATNPLTTQRIVDGSQRRSDGQRAAAGDR